MIHVTVSMIVFIIRLSVAKSKSIRDVDCSHAGGGHESDRRVVQMGLRRHPQHK